MVVQDGYQRLNLLPDAVAAQVVTDNNDTEATSARAEVVRADRVGAALRVVVAWDRPAGDAAATPFERLRSLRKGATPFEIGLRLYDAAAGTVAEPLRSATGACLCSNNTGRYFDSDKQALFWADFPAPDGDRVDLLLGEQVAALQDVPVSTDAPALDLAAAGELADWVSNAPPATVGEGATAPVVHDVRRSTQTFGGAEDAQVGRNADVSLPADVLFAVDSSSLGAPARQVLADAAPKLAAAAKGKRVQVVGHTDDQGTPAYNDDLSLRRARAVAAELGPRLRAAGISLVAVGKGESEHVAPNAEPDGTPIEANRQRNRRVSFVFPRARGAATTAIAVAKALPAMPVARMASPSPEVSGSLATVLSQDGTVRVHVTRAQRVGADLWLGFAFTSVGQRADWGSNPLLLGPNPYAANDTLANVRLVDPARKTIAPPLSFSQGACLCSENQGSGQLFPRPMPMWAVFPAPPAGTAKVVLRIPGAGQVGVSVS